jgi:hypothetical protein
MAWNPTNWRFVTSQDFEVTGGEGWPIGVTGGPDFLKSTHMRTQFEVTRRALARCCPSLNVRPSGDPRYALK